MESRGPNSSTKGGRGSTREGRGMVILTDVVTLMKIILQFLVSTVRSLDILKCFVLS